MQITPHAIIKMWQSMVSLLLQGLLVAGLVGRNLRPKNTGLVLDGVKPQSLEGSAHSSLRGRYVQNIQNGFLDITDTLFTAGSHLSPDYRVGGTMCVLRKRSIKERVLYWVGAHLISIGYDLSSRAFEDFAADNGYDYCYDCNGARLK